ncbi:MULTISPECIES: SIR2 family NAD-dependent protein deacylase [Flavobacterium]|uniref:SIR2 family NAD-dependent protein deacylase n=1 Tax=Flavobacterium TaxID=237 RepID=UPI0011845C6A|nr:MULTISPECIES: SIR2 family protein [Flavobacterium]MCR4029818.1 SIR2 family protein [Flavobacterium panacis]
MSVLDVVYKENIDKSNKKIWCDNDNHHLFENFTDFNDWLDGDDGQDIREQFGIGNLSQPSKAIYASDPKAYHQIFKEFHEQRINQVLSKDYIEEKFGDTHWFERNQKRFEEFEKCLAERTVVPFVGAGLSVEGGFPSWRAHLQQQGRTAGIDAEDITNLLDNGQYEEVIIEIERLRNRETFIQEIKDAFSKNGNITDTTLRLSELFTDTIITTNYDHLIEQAFDTGTKDNIQLIDIPNMLDVPDQNKTTIIKLHGDINTPSRCILGKNQYDDAYGNGDLDLTKPIPKLLSFHYTTSSLLFLGCSLNQDRTMQVFQAVKDKIGDVDRLPHFSLESMPENEDELAQRNSYLLSFGIIPIWFPRGRYDYIEQILRLAKNELRYKGYEPGLKKEIGKLDENEKKPTENNLPKNKWINQIKSAFQRML